MTKGELKDQIAFEGKIEDIDALGGYLDYTLGDILDGYCSQVKYDELYVQNQISINGDDSGFFTLPDNFQHIDLESILYSPLGDPTNGYYLLQTGSTLTIPDEGPSRFISFANGGLQIYPTDDVTVDDSISFNYWKKPSSLLIGQPDSALVLPNQLLQTAKMELIARANLFGDGKQFAAFRSLAREAHSNSLGSTPLPGMND